MNVDDLQTILFTNSRSLDSVNFHVWLRIFIIYHHANHQYRNSPTFHPRQAGTVARATLARSQGHGAGYACD